jgi:hypothetical protein|tara:strand:- start:26 stop:817 length:792 start_codon:yes stop_codon:yes gene_type:complete
MNLCNIVEQIHQGVTHSLIDKSNKFSLSDSLIEYSRSQPTLRRYFNPEFKYLLSRTRKFDQYMKEILEENINHYSENPSSLLDAQVKDLIQFKDREKQKKFIRELQYTIEDISYMAKIGHFESQQILNVKYNTPIVGNFARKKLKGINPDLENMTQQIDSLRDNSIQFLQELYPEQDEPFQSTEEFGLFVRYIKNIKDFNKHLTGAYYVNNANILEYHNRSASNSPRYDSLKKDLSYSINPYNGILEKIVGVIGSFINYILGS